MIVIYPDTNALHSDPRMLGRTSQNLLSLLEPGKVEVWLSPVVVEEVERQLREAAEKAIKDIESVVGKLPRQFDDVDMSLLEKITAPFLTQGQQALTPLLAHPACKVLDWSSVSAQELVQRELDRRKPTLLKNGQSIGLRDTVIWHDLLDAVSDLTMIDEVIFVTADGGYLADGTLDGALAQELEKRVQGAEPIPGGTTNVRVLGGVSHVYEQLSDRSARDKAIRLALIDLVEHLDEELWRKRDVAVQSAILPPWFTNPTLEATERIEIVSIGEGNPARCVARAFLVFDATVSIHGFIDMDVESWDIVTLGVTPSGNHVAIRFTTTATISAEISYDTDAKTASVGKGRVEWEDRELLALKREEARAEAMFDAAMEAAAEAQE